ncbi:MAG: hypothetical protein K9G38_08045 [Bacteroidales bacterium]|nr:hypothetical protein [Bacteroidales bacterium]
MKKIRSIAITLAIILSSISLSAQLPAIDFLYGATNDAELLLTEYMRPYADIMGANLNAGWYNTAKPHKLGGFDLTVTASVAFAPASALTYNLGDLNLQAEVVGSTGTEILAPTIAGNMESLPELVYSETVINPLTDLPETFETIRVSHPNGTGIEFLPMPMAQLTIGLIKGTDVSVRFVPDLAIGEYGEFGMFGIGGRHSISQWIPVLKQLKFINIALQGGYTKIGTVAGLNMTPKDVQVDPFAGDPNAPDWNDQFLNLNLSGWTMNLIASQSIPVITVYEGIGFASSAVDLALLGHYPLNSVVFEQGENFGKTTYTVVEDPIETLEFESNRNLRLNAGLRLKLGILTLHYDFTRTLYSTHTAGIGISFR